MKTIFTKIRAMQEELEALHEENRAIRSALDTQTEILSTITSAVEKIGWNADKLPFVMEKFKDAEMQHKLLLDPSLYPHAIKMWYQNKTGNVLDLENPITYNEKIQWMKIFDNDPRKTLLTDKIAVRDYVAQRAGSDILIPLIATYNYAEEIDFGSLPEQFVLKANHGCSMNAIVRDKHEADLDSIRRKAKKWLGTDFAFVNGYELHYIDIPHRLFAEKYIENTNGDLPDYKFWCFDGKVYYIMFLAERRTGLKMAFYDLEWNKMPFVYSYPRYEKEVEKPPNLNEMIQIAEKLSEGFSHARVDLYRLDNGEIKFGEITFSSASGSCRWTPPEADLMMGEHFVLPKVI